MSLAEKLNKYQVSPNTKRGKVTLEALPDNLDALCDDEGIVNNLEFAQYLDWLDTLDAYLDEHPYGREGGYVPHADEGDGTHFETAWYDANDGGVWKE